MATLRASFMTVAGRSSTGATLQACDLSGATRLADLTTSGTSGLVQATGGGNWSAPKAGVVMLTADVGGECKRRNRNAGRGGHGRRLPPGGPPVLLHGRQGRQDRRDDRLTQGVNEMAKFEVVRKHIGDRTYEPGDTREAAKTDVAHLIPHVLKPIEEPATPAAKAAKSEEPEPAKKAEPEPQNKAVSAPENKADTGRKGKA